MPAVAHRVARVSASGEEEHVGGPKRGAAEATVSEEERWVGCKMRGEGGEEFKRTGGRRDVG
jgi:hypothetical protein